LKKKYEDLKDPQFKKVKEFVSVDLEKKKEGISDFWFYVVKNSEAFSEILKERDEDSLKYLVNIDHTKFVDEKKPGYSIDFYFRENPYFENKVLKKICF